MNSSNFRNFDVADSIRNISSLWLRAQLFSSYAWRIDTLIVQQCRALFKTLKMTPMAQTLDSDADFRNTLTEGAWTEALFGEAGADTVQPVKTLWVLAGMRLEAHQDGADAAMLNPWPNGEPRQYNVPDVYDLFVPTGSTEPKGESLLRMQMTAERNAAKMASGKDVKALAKKFLEARIRIEKASMAAMTNNMAQQTDALNALYDYAMMQCPEELTCEFPALHVDSQRILIDSVINAAQRSVATAESRPKEVNFDDFCHLSVEADDLVDQLKAVLDSPKFNGGVKAVRVPKAAPTLADTKDKAEAKRKDQIEAQLSPVAAAKKVIAKDKAVRMAAKKEPKPKAVPATITTLADLGQVKDLLTASNDL